MKLVLVMFVFFVCSNMCVYKNHKKGARVMLHPVSRKNLCFWNRFWMVFGWFSVHFLEGFRMAFGTIRASSWHQFWKVFGRRIGRFGYRFCIEFGIAKKKRGPTTRN